MGKTILEFPSNFLFGTATSSFQVEGDTGERHTDWDDYLKKYPTIVDPQEKGPQWWEEGKAEADIKMISELGMKVQRISFEWGRIEPEKGVINHSAVKRYKAIVKSIKDCGMIPMVTLNHYTLPSWVAKKGSWKNREIIGFFKHYVKFVVNEFPEITYWLTLNEPNVVLIMGYLSHYFPPQDNNIFSTFGVWSNLVNAHKVAYRSIKKINPTARVGSAVFFRWNKPVKSHDIIERFYAYAVNNISQVNYVREINSTSDFIAVNFYSGYFLKFNFKKLRLSAGTERQRIHKTILFGELRDPYAYMSDYGWPIVPDFFLDLLKSLRQTFHKPIIVTENGIADKKDKNRSLYILTHLVAIWRALKDGVNIEQYIHWSTVDNLEWMEGYGKSFGLIALDPVTGKRTLRRSAHLYKDIATSGRIDVEDLLNKYFEGEQKERTDQMIRDLIAGRENQTAGIVGRILTP